MDWKMLSDKDVLDYIVVEGKLCPQRCLESVLKKHGLYDYIIHRYSNNTLNPDDKEFLRECIYRILNNIEEPPVCKICGKPIVFKNNSYAVYCSHACSNKDVEVLEKISNSCSKSLKSAYEINGDEIKKKRCETLSKKYNVESSSSSPFGIKEIQDLASENIQKKYGVTNVFLLDEVRRARIDSQRLQSIKLQRERGIDIEYTENGTYLVKNCCPIHGDLEFSQTDFNNRFRLSRYKVSNPCYICNPLGFHSSGEEKTLLDYIRSIYSGEIIENDKSVLNGLEIDIYLPELKIGFEFNGDYWHMNPLMYKSDDENTTTHKIALDKWMDDRHKVLEAEEMGIRLYHIWEYYFLNHKESVCDLISNIIRNNSEIINPLLKLKTKLDEIDASYTLIDDMIFEYQDVRIVYFDGFYFNENTISKDFLLSLKSEDKRTIFVYDYEITDDRKFEVIISDIRYALHKIDRRIFARNCELRIISNKESKQFLLDNSLFGYRSASLTFGLYYRDELVMVYSFGNNYYGRKKDTEVIRVCTKKNNQVIGGSSKCLKYYIDNYSQEGETLIFYVDAIHHNGDSMKTDGFEFIRHEFGTMNYYISPERFGEAFNRCPGRNREIKEKIKNKEIIEILTNGVDVYKKVIKK